MAPCLGICRLIYVTLKIQRWDARLSRGVEPLRALVARYLVVISSNPNLALPAGVELVNSLKAAIALLKDAPEIFVIGGGMLYKEALPLADRLYLTIIQAEIEGDTSFPAYDLNAYRVIAESFYPKDEKNAYDLRFVTLEKK